MNPRTPLLTCLAIVLLAAPLAAQDNASLLRQLIAERDAKQQEFNTLEQQRLKLQSELAALRTERTALGEDIDIVVSLSETLSGYQSQLAMLQHKIDLKLAEKNEFAVEYGRSTNCFRWFLVLRLVWSSPSWNARYEKYVGGLRKAREDLAKQRKLIDQEIRNGIPAGGRLARFSSEREFKRFIETYYADPDVDPESKEATRLRVSRLGAKAKRAGVRVGQLLSRSGLRIGGHVTQFNKGLDGLRQNVKWAEGKKGQAAHDLLPDGLSASRKHMATIEHRITSKEAEHDRINKRVPILAGQIDSLDLRIRQLREQPARPPRVIGRVLDVTPSQVLGTPPQRRCVWRFYIELEEMNDAPVELLFKQALRQPQTQDPDASRRHGPPPLRNTVKPNETVHLGGWSDISTGMWLLNPLSVRPGGGIDTEYKKAERKRKFGPFYLTVWEKGDFAGEFRAVFESVQPAAFAGEITEVVFAPKPPAWARIQGTVPVKVVHPTAREIASGSLGGRSFEPYIQVEVDAPDLGPGMYRLRVEVDKAGTRYLWCRLERGSRKLEFEGSVPMLPGRQNITLSMPDLPQIVPEQLNLNVVPPSRAASRESIRSSQKQIQRLQSEQAADTPERARRYRQRLANSYSNLAFKHIERGEFSTAGGYINQAMGHLQAAGAANELTTGGYGGDVNRGTLLGHMATVAYFTSATGEVRKNLTALADYYEASAAQCSAQGDERTARTLHGKAAECYWKMADQLLMLGVSDPSEAVSVWRRGQSYWEKTGARGERRKPGWWPE